jgi:RNA polymerase sigma factor (sigma-70 family)
VLEAQRRRAIGAALRQLSQQDRDVVSCRYFLDLSETETAAVLGLRRGTVKSRLSRALDRMRDQLESP